MTVLCGACELPWCACIELDEARAEGFGKGWDAAIEQMRERIRSIQPSKNASNESLLLAAKTMTALND